MSPTERWHAVLARDRRFDGAFVYAVRSTGIYCRPSCASRRPRRTQVTFFPIPEAGYSSSSRVYEHTHQQLGMTPATYARGGTGIGIAYVIVPTALGRLLVAATERGVCRVALGDTASALEAELIAEFPAARVVQD